MGKVVSKSISDFVAGSEAMANVLAEMAEELIGCTENSPEEIKLQKISDVLDAYTLAREKLFAEGA